MGEKTTTEASAYSPGLEGVVAGESSICQIDEGGAGLRYRGYAIRDLAEQATFEEVAHLLLLGALPAPPELAAFSEELRTAAVLPSAVASFLHAAPRHAPPMDLLRTAVSLLGATDPEGQDTSPGASVRKAIRLLAQIPLVVATISRASQGQSPVTPRPGLRFVEQLLFLLTGRQGDAAAAAMAHVLDVSLILYAEHELNASTFAARVAASTLADLHAAVTAAIAALKGPLHGGANEAVAAMLLEIGEPTRAEPWLRETLAAKRRVMGFGHRVLKHGDPRSDLVEREAAALSQQLGESRWYAIARTLHQIMLAEKGLHPNLDFYTAVAYLQIGIPRELYTPVFVCSRITGWCAHIIEQQEHNRLIRPRALYTGPAPRAFVPLAERLAPSSTS